MIHMFDTARYRVHFFRAIAQSLSNLTVLIIFVALAGMAGGGQELGRQPTDRAIPSALDDAKRIQDMTRGPCKVRSLKSKLTANLQFLPPVQYNSGGFEATAIAIGDLNCDRHLDIVVGHHCSSFDACLDASTVGLLLGNGDGTFRPAVTYSSGVAGIASLAIADVNDDGKPDLIVLGCGADCFNPPNSRVAILLGNGDGTFQPPVTYDTGSV